MHSWHLCGHVSLTAGNKPAFKRMSNQNVKAMETYNIVLLVAIAALFIVAIIRIRKRQLHDHTGYYGNPSQKAYVVTAQTQSGYDTLVIHAVTKQKAIQKYRIKEDDYQSQIKARKL